MYSKMKISNDSMSRFIKRDIKLSAYDRYTGNLLTEQKPRCVASARSILIILMEYDGPFLQTSRGPFNETHTVTN